MVKSGVTVTWFEFGYCPIQKLQAPGNQFVCVCVCVSHSVRHTEGWCISTVCKIWAGTVRGSNPGEVEIFRTNPDRPWGPPNLLYNGYRVSFPTVKAVGA